MKDFDCLAAKRILIVFGLILFGISTTPVFADTWARGNIVGLCKGTRIRTGPGKNYTAHTVVPENDWAVKLIDRHSNAKTKRSQYGRTILLDSPDQSSQSVYHAGKIETVLDLGVVHVP